MNVLEKTVKKDIVMISLTLAVCIALMSANFYYIIVQDRQDKQTIAIAGELRILSQSIAKHAVNAADGLQDAFTLLRKRRDDFDASLLVLKKGDARLNLPASSLLIRQHELQTLDNTWQHARKNVDTILGRQELLVALHVTALQMQTDLPIIKGQYEHLIQLLLDNKAPRSQVEIAIKQYNLAQSIYQQVDKVATGGTGVVYAAESFARDASYFNKLQKALLSGSRVLEIAAVTHPQAIDILNKISKQFNYIQENIEYIKKTSVEFGLVNGAAFDIYVGSQNLLEQATLLMQAYTHASEIRFIGEPTGYMLGATSLMLFLWLIYRAYDQARVRLIQTHAQHKANRAAVWRLLDELANLADGDLTVTATVSEDMTGAIAESVNYAIDALRKLVFTINETAVSVSTSAQEAQSTATHLAQASESQAREIVGATAAINAMAYSIENVSTNAPSSAAVAKESVDIAKSGVKVVQNTMIGMDKIREQMQETSKQIKRLGESTQEIGNMVALINDIADQTHVLALNASIQAAMAGEAGLGFAVVAEEVQHLAERATQATNQVETLVHTIQSDSNETIKSMEQTTKEVVTGAKLSKEAGVALARIENVSMSLAELIHTISTEANIQAQTSNQVSSTMEVIKDIANQTAVGTSVTANSIGSLAELAIELRESVAGFKLPVDNDPEEYSRAG